MENIGLIVCAIYVCGMGIVDLKKKEIPVLPGIILLLLLTVWQLLCCGKSLFWLLSLLPAGALFAVSKGSRGAIGEGDALIFGVTGMVFGLYKNVELLIVSLMLCSFVAGALFLFRHVGRKYKIPFVPFVAVGYGLVVMM